MLNGYDISDNQGNIDNTQVPGDFVIIKATEGVGYTDPDCDANYQQAKGAGKLLGIYHFARPDGNDPVSEAKWFVSQVQGYIGEAILILDLETQPITPEWAKQWLDTVYELTEVRPWIYMNQSTANSLDWSSVWGDYSLWVAAYGIDAPINGYQPSQAVSVNGNWTIAAWQYTSKGRLPGWGGFLDLNVLYGDATAWHKYASKQATVQVPTPVTVPEQPVVPVVETSIPPVLPIAPPAPIQTPVSTVPPAVNMVLPPVKTPSPFKQAFIALLRQLVFSLPGFAIQIVTNDPALTLGYGVPVLYVLHMIDNYLRANPNIKLNGLLPF